MTQDDLRIDPHITRQRRGSSRAELMISETTAAAEAVTIRVAETGADRLGAGLRAQTRDARRCRRTSAAAGWSGAPRKPNWC